jgi:hypothetical protein
MKNFLAVATFLAAAICGTAVAQSTAPSSSDLGTSQTQPPATTQSAQPPQSGAPSQSVPSQPVPTQLAPAQSTAAGPAAQGQKIAPGSVIPVELTKTIDAKKAKAGDEVVARVTQDMKTNGGEVLVAKDTKIMGHVTAAQPRTKEQKESELGIAFDHAMTKTGEMQQPMSIQAIIAPLNNAAGGDNGGNQGTPATGGSTASSPMGSRNTSMGGAPPPPPASTGAAAGTDTTAAGGARPPITGSTQGVIGMPELKLLEANAQNTALGSVMSSEKGNVKLESGTLMLLRVNP